MGELSCATTTGILDHRELALACPHVTERTDQIATDLLPFATITLLALNVMISLVARLQIRFPIRSE